MLFHAHTFVYLSVLSEFYKIFFLQELALHLKLYILSHYE